MRPIVAGTPRPDPERSGPATTQVAEIANKTQPGLLVMYHRGVGPRGKEISDAQYVAEVSRTYRGKVVVGNDLDVY